MLLNNLRAAARGLLKNPLYSLINIGGLAIALCACMLILLYVLHEHSYDTFEKNGDRIFSVNAEKLDEPFKGKKEIMSFVTGPMLKEQDPDVESFTRIDMRPSKMALKDKTDPTRIFNPERPIYADSNFFTQFSIPLIEGNADQALVKPFSVVLTRPLAKTLFGNADPMGRLLTLDGKYTLEVTGVAAEPPSNAYLDFDMVCSLSSYPEMKEHQWWISQDINLGNGNFKTYIRLREAKDSAKVGKVAAQLAQRHKPSQFDAMFNGKYRYFLSPLGKEHMTGSMGRAANLQYLKIFTLVAILILALALINYMSLSTARGAIRAKEVGVRKTLGAGKGTLALQFYRESAVYTFLAFFIGLLLFIWLRPAFLNLLQVQIDPGFGYTPKVLLAFAALLAATIIIAGSYPALLLSSFRPVDNLSGRLIIPRGGQFIRKVLTVFQFSVASGLVVIILVMKQQIFFFQHKDIGMNRDNILMIPVDNELDAHYDAFQAEINSLPGVMETATSGYALFKGAYSVALNGGQFEGKNIQLYMMDGDSALFSTLRLRWKVRPPVIFQASNYTPIVLNETAASLLGLPGDPTGTTLAYSGKEPQMIVTGVVEDFAFSSVSQNIGPLAIEKIGSLRMASQSCCLLARYAPHTDLPGLIKSLRKVYAKYPSLNPFSYEFADDAFDKLYKAEDRLAQMMGVFSVIALIIACLGLFGLATFSTLQRTREIGIRKVLGAEVLTIVRLLARDFLRLVAIAILIAAPLSWWIMNSWLDQFAYRITMSPWVIAGAGLGVIVLAVLTVGSLALKAARANPAESLRND